MHGLSSCVYDKCVGISLRLECGLREIGKLY